MTKRRTRFIHFLSLETGRPLCDGEGEGAERAAVVNGVGVCAVCARRLASHERARSAARTQPPSRA